MRRAFPYPLLRAATNVALRALGISLVLEEMYRGTPVIYIDFTDYDEIAHHSGPERPDALDALDGVDKAIGTLQKASEDASRPYRFVVLSDRYIFTALARAGVRGVDRQWLRNLYGFAIAPHMVFYLNVDVKTLIARVLQSRGMDFWESGMDLKTGDDIYDSFRQYQSKMLKEYSSMGDEFHFRLLDARRPIDRIQDELRKQVAAFLEPQEKPADAASLVKG